MSETYVVKSIAEVTALAHSVLVAAGADDENAGVVAEHLALADASGITTHGIVHLPGYLEDVSTGGILPASKSRVVIEDVAYALIHGGWTFGQVGAQDAMDLAVDKARTVGVAMVGLVGAHHIGRLGHFVERAAAAGCASMVWAGGFGEETPHVAPFGGRDRVLGTNPIAFGFPGGSTAPVGYDFATTTVAGMRVVVARQGGRPLPPNSIIGPDGVPTSDPEQFFNGGAHLPFGGHKGFALSIAAEWLGRVLTASDRFAEPGRANAILGHQGVLFIAMRADAFAPGSVVEQIGDDMYRRVGSTRPAPGVERVLLPGQLEAEARDRSLEDGLRIDRAVWDEISALPRRQPDEA